MNLNRNQDAWSELRREGDILAQQNEILRSALEECIDDSREVLGNYEQVYGENYKQYRLQLQREKVEKADAALALPDISTDILRQRDARTLREAAETCNREGVEKFWPTYTSACHFLAVKFEKMAEALENGK